MIQASLYIHQRINMRGRPIWKRFIVINDQGENSWAGAYYKENDALKAEGFCRFIAAKRQAKQNP